MTDYRNIPQDGDLSALRAYRPDNGRFVWTVVCRCGNNKLLLVGQAGARCHGCGTLHSRDALERESEKCRRRARFDDLGVARTAEPAARVAERTMVLDAATGKVHPVSGKLRAMLNRSIPPPVVSMTGEQIIHRKKVKLENVLCPILV